MSLNGWDAYADAMQAEDFANELKRERDEARRENRRLRRLFVEQLMDEGYAEHEGEQIVADLLAGDKQP